MNVFTNISMNSWFIGGESTNTSTMKKLKPVTYKSGMIDFDNRLISVQYLCKNLFATAHIQIEELILVKGNSSC